MGDAPTGSRSGRRTILLAFSLVIPIAGGFGLYVGALLPNSATVGLWMLQFHPTPAKMALYGIIAMTIILGTLLGLVHTASRFDPKTTQ